MSGETELKDDLIFVCLFVLDTSFAFVALTEDDVFQRWQNGQLFKAAPDLLTLALQGSWQMRPKQNLARVHILTLGKRPLWLADKC